MAETLVNKNQAGEGLWTADNLIAGTDISITQVPQPLIDENTICLWHLDDDVNNTIEGGNPFFPSASWTFSNARFGKGLFYSSTSTQQSIGFPNYSNTQNFTLDFWFKLTQSNKYFVFYTYYNASQRLEFYNTYLSLPGSTVSTVTYPSGINVLDWTHFALVNDYSSNKTYYFINGIKFHEASSFYYLQNGALARYGAIDEVRVSNVARWTSDFTPFTVPYAASAGPTQYAINNTKADPDLSSYLQNTATGSNSLTIGGTATTSTGALNISKGAIASSSQAIAIGLAAEANGINSISIGASSSAGTTPGYSTAIGTSSAARTTGTALGSYSQARGLHSVAIGGATGSSSNIKTEASAEDSIAIGYNAKATATNAIQLGSGTNSTASTFKVFNTTVLNASGKIPAANLDTAIPTVDQTYSASSANAQSGTAVASAVSTKADTDLSNVTKPYVTETYVNGTSWYRVYSDGWCEQGGYSSTASTTINLLKPFINTNYTIATAVVTTATGGSYATCIQKNTTNFIASGTQSFNWQACGYIR